MAVLNSVGNSLTGITGTGNFVGANTPTLITPNIGAATGTSVAPGNLLLSGNTLASTDTNGNINIIPDGTGKLNLLTSTSLLSSLVTLARNGASASQTLGSFANNASASTLYFLKSRSTTVGSKATVNTNDSIASIAIYADDGTNYVNCAEILVQASGVVSTGIIPTKMSFFTSNASGASTVAIEVDQNQLVILANALPVTSGGTGLASTTVNQLLYSSATSTIAGLATANNGVLVTSAGGVPSISSTLPSGIAATNMALTTPSIGVATGTSLTTTGAITSSGAGFISGSPAGGVAGSISLNSNTASRGYMALSMTDNAANYTTSLTNASFGQSSTLTIPDPGAATANFLLNTSAAGQSINYRLTSPSVAFSSTSGIIGTTTNDSAAAGSVGELSSSANATGVAMTTATITQIQTLSLGAGDWDVWCTFYTTVNAATVSQQIACQLHTSTATIADPTTAQLASIASIPCVAATGQTTYLSTGISRWTLAGATTVYLNAVATYSINTLTGNGMIHARRRR